MFVCYWMLHGIFQDDKTCAHIQWYGKTNPWTINNYNDLLRLQQDPTQCLWIVPGTLTEED